MVNITIKNVPKGAEKNVLNAGVMAAEDFLRGRDLQVSQEVKNKLKADINAIRKANGLSENPEEI